MYSPTMQMRFARWMALVVLLCSAMVGFSQTPTNNPVVDFSRTVGERGLSKANPPKTSPLKFKPGSKKFVSKFVEALFSDGKERQAIQAQIEQILTSFDDEAKKVKRDSDGAYALAFSIGITYGFATGKEVNEKKIDELASLFSATFDRPQIRTATDAQKQEFYEWSLCQSALLLTLISGGSDAETLKKLQTVASAQFTAMIGARIEDFTIDDNGIQLKSSVTESANTTPAVNGMAPGFAYSLPKDWKQDGAWSLFRFKDEPTDTSIHGALVRFPAAIPAKGNMGDALRELWKQHIPVEGDGKFSQLVFRRFVGDQLFTQFIFGRVREKGRIADSLFTLYLVDCGSVWQPIVVANSYEETSEYKVAGADFSAQFSYPKSAKVAEQFLATLRCPNAKSGQIVDGQSIAGAYYFGSGANMNWVNIYTGATSTTFISTGGSLNLKPNGQFEYNYSSASGAVGATTFRGAKGDGKWSVDGDLLVCKFANYDQGDGYKKAELRYRIAGHTVFPDGEKILVIKDDLDQPVNATTVGSNAEYYTTKKK